jgi:hypothetical protein
MIVLNSYNTFVAAMQQPSMVPDTALAAILCSVAAVFTHTAIKQEVIRAHGIMSAQVSGFKQELILWRAHREQFSGSRLRKRFVVLSCVSVCLLVTAIASRYYREDVPPAVLTISSK